MKKKILSSLLAICLMITCSFAMIGCNKDDTATGLTKADYVEAIDSVTSSVNAYVNQPSAQAMSLSVVLEEGDFINVDNKVGIKEMLAGTTALIIFMKNILNTDGYVLKDTTDDCVASYDNGHSVETYDIRFKLSYDEATSTIKIPVYAEYDYGNPESPTRATTYFIFDIVYDFDTEVLSKVDVYGYAGPVATPNPNGVQFLKYANNSVDMINTESSKFADFAQEVLADMAEFMSAEKETAPEDYTVQYTDAMNASNPNA